MTPDDGKQLSFDFMNGPKQLSPKAEYAAYLRSIRDQSPNLKGGSHGTAKTQGRESVPASS